MSMSPPTRTRIEKLSSFDDARGTLFEPLDAAGLALQRNTHVVLTEPGCIRGNHYHLSGTEISVIRGPALVRLKEDGVLYNLTVPAGEVWRLAIPPGVVHAYQNTGGAPMLLVAFNTELHDPARPDVVREEILCAQ